MNLRKVIEELQHEIKIREGQIFHKKNEIVDFDEEVRHIHNDITRTKLRVVELEQERDEFLEAIRILEAS